MVRLHESVLALARHARRSCTREKSLIQAIRTTEKEFFRRKVRKCYAKWKKLTFKGKFFLVAAKLEYKISCVKRQFFYTIMRHSFDSGHEFNRTVFLYFVIQSVLMRNQQCMVREFFIKLSEIKHNSK